MTVEQSVVRTLVAYTRFLRCEPALDDVAAGVAELHLRVRQRQPKPIAQLTDWDLAELRRSCWAPSDCK